MLASCLALVIAACVTAGADDRVTPFPDGLYGNVTYGAESGDLGGFEVRFFVDPATGKTMAEFTLCEGWCNEIHVAEVTRDGDGFALSHVETLVRHDGDKPAATEDHTVAYRITRAGRDLRVSYAYDGEAFDAREPWRIKPLQREYGLDVARGEKLDAR